MSIAGNVMVNNLRLHSSVHLLSSNPVDYCHNNCTRSRLSVLIGQEAQLWLLIKQLAPQMTFARAATAYCVLKCSFPIWSCGNECHLIGAILDAAIVASGGERPWWWMLLTVPKQLTDSAETRSAAITVRCDANDAPIGAQCKLQCYWFQ